MTPVAVLKGTRPVMVDCGKLGCEGDHEMWDVRDAFLVQGGVPSEGTKQWPLDKGLLAMSPDGETVFPTLLGWWWESVDLN